MRVKLFKIIFEINALIDRLTQGFKRSNRS